MARMGDIEAEAWAAIRRGEQAVTSIWRHDQPGEHPYASTETPATPATIGTTTQEDDMSKLSDDLHAVASRLEKFDDEALAKLEAVQGSDVTAEAFTAIAALTHVNPSPVLTAVIGTLKALAPAEAPVEPAPEPVAAPAGPQFSGQAQ